MTRKTCKKDLILWNATKNKTLRTATAHTPAAPEKGYAVSV